jgi:hypothetical protein
VQIEHDVSALVMRSVVLLPTLALGTATAAPDHKEVGRKYYNALEEEHQYPLHGEEDTIGAEAIYRPNCGQNPSPTLLRK